MTKKDYIIIAQAVKSARQNVGPAVKDRQQTIDEVVNLLCYALYGDNPKFVAQKFAEACNLSEVLHDFRIISLHDAQAKCSCGWSFTATGERTSKELKKEYLKHYKQSKN